MPQTEAPTRPHELPDLDAAERNVLSDVAGFIREQVERLPGGSYVARDLGEWATLLAAAATEGHQE